MKFELAVRNYLKDAYRFSKICKDGKSRLLEVAELYDRLCRNFSNVIPDACLNKMLDTDSITDELNAMMTLTMSSDPTCIPKMVDALVLTAEQTESEQEFMNAFMYQGLRGKSRSTKIPLTSS